MKILNFMQWINEAASKQHVYDKGCVMLFFDFPEMKELQEDIDEDDLYTEPEDDSYGLEDEPHCTILYGLEPEVELKDIKGVVKQFTYSPLIAHKASLFKNDKYDVLKMDIGYVNPDEENRFLHDCNKELKTLPFESSFPNYHPHMTIAYLKSGKGDKYVKLLKDKEFEIEPENIVFSETDGTKTPISIKIVKNDTITK